jgi:amino acid transporter
MKSGKQPHILNAASNLLGICFILITGLKITDSDIGTFADEISIFAALTLMISCLLSYASIRAEKNSERWENWADALFLAGMISLCVAMLVFVTDIV